MIYFAWFILESIDCENQQAMRGPIETADSALGETADCGPDAGVNSSVKPLEMSPFEKTKERIR